MKNSLKKVLYGICSGCLAFTLYLGTSSISILFFGEPDFPSEN